MHLFSLMDLLDITGPEDREDDQSVGASLLWRQTDKIEII